MNVDEAIYKHFQSLSPLQQNKSTRFNDIKIITTNKPIYSIIISR
jgi:hypothetical protein